MSFVYVGESNPLVSVSYRLCRLNNVKFCTFLMCIHYANFHAIKYRNCCDEEGGGGGGGRGVVYRQKKGFIFGGTQHPLDEAML